MEFIMNRKRHSIWMPLIGFDKNKPDKGVDEYIKSVGFVPDKMSVFLFHSDVINQHMGMDKEIVLPIDCCAYYGAPRNMYRERQEWTNYDLRELAKALRNRGIEAYIGIMGVYLYDVNHKEWQSDHLELLSYGVNGRMNLNVLKRFNDGTFYEDFFADKAFEAINDYGFSGLHVADFFCPPEHSIANGDFSADMLCQFREHSGIIYPPEIEERLCFNEQHDINIRQEYIWNTLRREWIEFYAWRWGEFWSRVSSKLHSANKKIMVNNAWCSDPFEALYRYGIDYRVLYEAGVDVICAETVPDSGELLHSDRGRLFSKYMSAAQLMSVYNPDRELLTLLNVMDCTEEWDILHHSPTRLERAMFYLGNMYTLHNNKLKSSSDGYFITLGDGITDEEGKWLNKRADLAFNNNPTEIPMSTILWSDHGHRMFLDEYIKTRRPSVHKHIYGAQIQGASTGAAARFDELDNIKGAIFVPNLDLCSLSEQKMVMSYSKGAVICTATKGYIDKSKTEPDLYFEDILSDCKMCIFAFNLGDMKERANIALKELFENATIEKNPYGEPKLWKDERFFSFPMPHCECSDAFYKGLSYLINHSSGIPIDADCQSVILKLDDGTHRLYLINLTPNYQSYRITTRHDIDSVSCCGTYPVMPPRMFVKEENQKSGVDGARAEAMKIGMKLKGKPYGFIAKVAPSGISMFDLKFKDI